MRKVLILGGVTFATLLLTYFVWVQFPKVSDSALVEQASRSGQEYFASGQVGALDPAKNGFLEPELLPLWGRKGQEYDEKAAAGPIVAAWKEFSSSAQGRPIDHKKLVATKDPAYLKARSDFQGLVGPLKTAMRRETFVAPDSRFNFDTVLPNYLAIRECAHGVGAMAEASVALGQPDAATAFLGDLYCLGKGMGEKSATINEMFVCAVTGVADAYLLELFPPAHDPPAASAQALLKDLLASVPSPERKVNLFKGEMSCGLEFFEQLRAGQAPVSFTSLSGLTQGAHLPGWAAREERIYANVHLRLLGELEKSGKVTYSQADTQPTFIDFFTGQAGIMTSVLLPNLSAINDRLDMDRARRVALGTIYAARAFRAEKGRLPNDIAELKAAYPALPEAESVGLTYQREGEKATVTIPYSLAQEYLGDLAAFPNAVSWVEAENDGLAFRF